MRDFFLYRGRSIAAFILAGLILCGLASSQAAENQPLVWDSTSKTNHPHFGEASTSFDFFVTNKSTNAVAIDDIGATCGCTVASLPSKPWILKPGETNHLPVLVDIRGKTGSIFKGITIVSRTSPVTLYVTVQIEPAQGTNAMAKDAMDRVWGQQLAAIDRQGVFTRQECLGCHLVPSFGKNGAQLYATACGICHEAEHRATMVPDLHALKNAIPANYWHQWIAHGKPGTLMPAFTAREGGPLTDAQIDSLVAFLSKEFPRPALTAGQGEDDVGD